MDATEALPDALARHDGDIESALASGDPVQIKRAYERFAADLLDSIGDGDVPLLSYPETAAAVADLLAGTQGPHLDVGCGPNPLASFLVARDGRMVVGLDMGAGMVTLARRLAAEAGVDFLGVVGDAEHLPFRDGVFGSVVCDDTIEHLPDDDAGAREFAVVEGREGLPALVERLRSGG